MTRLLDLTPRSAWAGFVQGGPASRIRDTPSGLLAELFDGDEAPWNNVAGQVKAEVAQTLTGFILPYGQERWVRMRMRYEAVANQPSRDWHFCMETHLAAGGTSAPWAVNLQGQQHQFCYTPQGWGRIWPEATFRPVKLGETFTMDVGLLPHTSNGWFEVWYDGRKVWEVRNARTIAVAEAQQLKVGWYRPIGITGTDRVVFEEFTVHDSRPAFAGTPPPPPPPPPPDPQPEPGVTLTAANAQAVRDAAAVILGNANTLESKAIVTAGDRKRRAKVVGTKAKLILDVLD